MRFVRPDLYITVLDASTADFKLTARQFLDRANAVVLHDQSDSIAWNNVSLKPVAGKPIFRIQPPAYVTPELVEFVRGSPRKFATNCDAMPFGFLLLAVATHRNYCADSTARLFGCDSA